MFLLLATKRTWWFRDKKVFCENKRNYFKEICMMIDDIGGDLCQHLRAEPFTKN